jgi:hypothetical protein
VLETHPELFNKGASEEAIAAFKVCVTGSLECTPRYPLESLIESMPRRIAVVLAAQGWHTKY